MGARVTRIISNIVIRTFINLLQFLIAGSIFHNYKFKLWAVSEKKEIDVGLLGCLFAKFINFGYIFYDVYKSFFIPGIFI